MCKTPNFSRIFEETHTISVPPPSYPKQSFLMMPHKTGQHNFSGGGNYFLGAFFVPASIIIALYCIDICCHSLMI